MGFFFSQLILLLVVVVVCRDLVSLASTAAAHPPALRPGPLPEDHVAGIVDVQNPGAEEEAPAGDDEDGGGYHEEAEEDVLGVGRVKAADNELAIVGRVVAGEAGGRSLMDKEGERKIMGSFLLADLNFFLSIYSFS